MKVKETGVVESDGLLISKAFCVCFLAEKS